MATHTSTRTIDSRRIIQKFLAGEPYPTIARKHHITVAQVRRIIERYTERKAAGVKPVSQDPIGIHFHRVRPYVCPACKERNSRTPPTIYKPCVKCLAEVGK